MAGGPAVAWPRPHSMWRVARSAHRSTHKLGRLLQIHHNLVAKAWQRAGLQPHRFARYMESDDPDFERKAADVIGLYVNPPHHAAVFAVDEKTAIQALDRLDFRPVCARNRTSCAGTNV